MLQVIERGIRSPENWPEIVSKYSININGVDFFTIENAFNLARDERIALKQDVKQENYTLTQHDLIEIAQYGPQTDWNVYLDLKTKNKEYFIKKYPELEIIKDNIDLEDMFFYALNVYTQTMLSNKNKLERKKLLNKAEYIGKDLLIKLYGNEEQYLDPSYISVLEPYILSFDQYITDQNYIMEISSRLGIALDSRIKDPSLPEQLYLQLDGIINLLYTENGIKDTFYINEMEITLEDIINLQYVSFLTLYEKLNLPNADASYNNRLILFLKEYA